MYFLLLSQLLGSFLYWVWSHPWANAISSHKIQHSMASDHLDLTCIVKKKWAALPFFLLLFFHSLFSFNCLSLMSRSEQYMNGGRGRRQKVKDELMEGRISTLCPFFKDLLLYSTVSQSFLVSVSVWKPHPRALLYRKAIRPHWMELNGPAILRGWGLRTPIL